MKTRELSPSALVVALFGCGGTSVVVESDTSWAGDICSYFVCSPEDGDREFRGSGNKSFTANQDGGDKICYWFGKTADSGFLRVYIKDDDILASIFGYSKNAEHETSASHGSVSDCYKP